MGETNRN